MSQPLTMEMLEAFIEKIKTQPAEPTKWPWACCGRAGLVWGAPAKCPNCGRSLWR